MQRLGPWVVLAVAAPLLLGMALFEYALGHFYLIRAGLVVGAIIASIASLYTTALARVRGERVFVTPTAVAGFAVSVSCILLARHPTKAVLLIWAANVAVSSWGLSRAIRDDRSKPASPGGTTERPGKQD